MGAGVVTLFLAGYVIGGAMGAVVVCLLVMAKEG